RHLARCGVAEVILCTGYKAEVIERHVGERAFRMRVRMVREDSPLGTAGALRLALPHVGKRAFAVNGDSFADVDLGRLIACHDEHAARATVVGTRCEDSARFGALRTDGPWLVGFDEKGPGHGPGLINAGVYVLDRTVLESVAGGRPVSLERETLPSMLSARE